MYPDHVPLREDLRQAHANTWTALGQAGDYFTGSQRVEFVRVARDALTCQLCEDRQAALSPASVSGEHDTLSNLDPILIDMIHRLRTDPGRLTKAWFDNIMTVVSPQEYVEIVAVVTSSVIVDTLHNALGQGLAPLPLPARGRPRRKYDEDAIDAGAWVPITAVAQEMSDTGLPNVPNIVRALGLVPGARDLFFGTFRPHYALKDINLSISQGQAEFVAARVSAMNECFY